MQDTIICQTCGEPAKLPGPFAYCEFHWIECCKNWEIEYPKDLEEILSFLFKYGSISFLSDDLLVGRIGGIWFRCFPYESFVGIKYPGEKSYPHIASNLKQLKALVFV